MRSLARLALLGCTLAAGCAKEPTPPTRPVDGQLEIALSIARFAFRDERYDRAAELYERALERARTRDDHAVIATISYELAVTQLRLGDPEGALATTRRAIEEARWRDAAEPPELGLAEAATLQDLGRMAEARDRALEVAGAASDPLTVARARFIAGRASAELGDRAGLAAAIRDLAHILDPPAAVRADRLELEARAAVMTGDAAGAARQFRETAALRQETLDYRAMAVALAGAAEAEAAMGADAEAADGFLRAGRIAASKGESNEARLWLHRAADLASGTGLSELAREARELIEGLPAT